MKLIVFYLISFGYSWIVWFSGNFLSIEGNVNSTLLISLGGIGPLIGLLIFLFILKDRNYREDYFKRLFNLKRKNIKYLILVLLAPFAILILSNTIDYFFFRAAT